MIVYHNGMIVHLQEIIKKDSVKESFKYQY